MSEIQRLRNIVTQLRAPDGCPWDREQTLETIVPFTLEECYELADTITRGDFEHLKEEVSYDKIKIALII